MSAMSEFDFICRVCKIEYELEWDHVGPFTCFQCGTQYRLYTDERYSADDYYWGLAVEMLGTHNEMAV